MKKLVAMVLVAVVGLSLSLPNVQAADQGSKQVTQGELASMLVRITGLTKYLPNNFSPVEASAVCLLNGIAPDGGWKMDQVVTRADLAKVVVQAMGKVDEVSNPDDPQAYIDYLKSIGVPIDTVTQAVGNLGPSADSVGLQPDNVGSTDPIKDPGPERGGGLNEGPTGTLLQSSFVTAEEVEKVIAAVPPTTPRRPARPTTTDGP